MAPKSKSKKPAKRQIVETNQIEEPFKVETKVETPLQPQKEKEEIKVAQPLVNLAIVREASISSEEGKSIKQSQRQKSSKNQGQESKKLTNLEQNPIKEEAVQQQEVPFDQYNVLKISGLLDAYEHFLKLLCKHGLPTGKIYEYAAQEIQKYERKKINKELRMRAELDIQKISKRAEKSSPSLQKPRNSSPYYS